MSDQNIFDNPGFFNSYRLLRSRDDNYNDLLEQPAMAELLPDIQGKSVLDLGCGYGHNCIDFIRNGASRVVGLDISEKMLQVARSESQDLKIEYINMSMVEISSIKEKFDFVYSSLAFHYIKDFEKLIKSIYSLLNHDGYLLFSQEHPIVTASIGGSGYFNKDKNGNSISYTFSNYCQPGKREVSWYVDGVIKYHRNMGEVLTTIAKAGFILKEICEPLPQAWAVQKQPSIVKEFLRPCFLIVKAKKE